MSWFRMLRMHSSRKGVYTTISFMYKEWFNFCKKSSQLSLYISKAFNSIGWPYLLEVLTVFGFSTKWCNWISTILRSSSSKILINGRPSQNIKICKMTEARRSAFTPTFCRSSKPTTMNHWTSDTIRYATTGSTESSKLVVLSLRQWCGFVCKPVFRGAKQLTKKSYLSLEIVQGYAELTCPRPIFFPIRVTP